MSFAVDAVIRKVAATETKRHPIRSSSTGKINNYFDLHTLHTIAFQNLLT